MPHGLRNLSLSYFSGTHIWGVDALKRRGGRAWAGGEVGGAAGASELFATDSSIHVMVEYFCTCTKN